MRKHIYSALLLAVLMIARGVEPGEDIQVQLPVVQAVAVTITVKDIQPKIELPAPVIPVAESVKTEVPAVDKPEAETPAVDKPEAETPAVDKPEAETPEVDKPEAETPEVDKPEAETPEVEDPAKQVGLIQSFICECKKLFRDQRGILQDKTMYFYSSIARKWISIYKGSSSFELAKIPLPSGIRMAAEVHCPVSIEILGKNLDFYQTRGINAVLLTFGYANDDMTELQQAAALIRQKGMSVWFAWSGPEKLQHSVFRDPDQLTQELKSLARVCDGFLIGWRRTSLHLFEQDSAYTEYVLQAVREANPAIAVVGEAYYGQTASSKEQIRNLQYAVPANASGVLITGLGYNGVAVESVMENLLSGIRECDKLALITGDRPYYATRKNNGLSFAENLQIKKQIADRWLKAGAKGVVILHGDGSDGIYEPTHNDNLAQMEVKP